MQTIAQVFLGRIQILAERLQVEEVEEGFSLID